MGNKPLKSLLLSTESQILMAIIIFILGLLVLPNILVYAVSIFASFTLIQDNRLKLVFIVIFSLATIFSFALLFTEEITSSPQTQPVVVKSLTPEVRPEPNTNAQIVSENSHETNDYTDIKLNSNTETLANNAGTPNTASTSEGTAVPTSLTSSLITDEYAVVSVVDGDTVKLAMQGRTETIRLIGINTPETVHPSRPVECMGAEASDKAKQLLTGKVVRFESDDTQGARDRFGRLLGYLFLPNGDNVGEVMIRSGYAHEYTYSNVYRYQSTFKAAEQTARTNEVGLWAEGVCEIETTKPSLEYQLITPSESDGQKWYVSSHHSSKFYYCESAAGWKALSPKYLKVYNSEADLRALHVHHTLHGSCL